MRIGVFGGTFDPVHLGHLIAAEQCRDQAKLDQVLIIPSARPPHKQDRPLTQFSQRVEMLRLAIAGHPVFQVDELERDREGYSYTADTLEELQRRSPTADLWLIIGSDCLPDIPGWHQPNRIIAAAGLLIVGRPGSTDRSVGELRASLRLAERDVLRHQTVEMPLIEISSRDIHRRIAAGQSIRYLVPRAVECYIETHGLYGGDEGSQRTKRN
jgi:nicotinate-nucleotide adenylyltransferase